MIDALAWFAAWAIVGSLAFLAIGWLLWPAILGGARIIGRILYWSETRRR